MVFVKFCDAGNKKKNRKNMGKMLDSLMGCDLGNLCAKAERQTGRFV
jgi:hypothetical protein